MKKLSTLVLLIAVATVFNACKKSGGSSGGTTPPVATPKYTKKVLVEEVTEVHFSDVKESKIVISFK